MRTIKAQVHRLPTENETHITHRNRDDVLLYHKDLVSNRDFIRLKGQYLYFTTDEEIKEGDWCINPKGFPEIFGYDFRAVYTKEEINNCRKIVATTDPKLIADGVAEIEQSFIEEYCKASGIDEVLVLV